MKATEIFLTTLGRGDFYPTLIKSCFATPYYQGFNNELNFFGFHCSAVLFFLYIYLCHVLINSAVFVYP